MIAAVLILAATPLLGLRTGVDFGIASLSGTPSGKGEQVLARSFGAGTLAPIEIVIAGRRDDPGRLALADAARAASWHASSRADRPRRHRRRRRNSGPRRDAAHGRHPRRRSTPTAPNSSCATSADAPACRSATAGGSRSRSAARARRSSTCPTKRAPRFRSCSGLILALSLIFLTIVFRSLVLPIKAVAMNLLATAATVGIVIFIFQQGHGEHLLGFRAPASSRCTCR